MAWLASLGALVVAAVLFDITIRRANHPRIDANDPAQIDVGRLIYAKSCSSCHGQSLEGAHRWPQRSPNSRLAAPPLGSTGNAWRWRDAQLFAITRDGPAAYPTGYSTDMPAFGHALTDDEIAAVLAYVKSQWPAEMQAQQIRSNLLPWTKIAH
jgi:mono/diheme cytochrome c family protein